MGVGPAKVVDAPPASPPLNGLVRSARLVDEPDDRWMNGILYAPEQCSDGRAADPCNPGTFSIAGNPTEINYEPFIVMAGDRCSGLSFPKRDYIGRARRQLLAVESFFIERELWTGTIARTEGHSNRYLASITSDVVTDTPTTPLRALACLEQYLAECYAGQQGMIHAMPQIVTHWSENGLIRRDGNRLVTIMETVVVAGSGYTGSDPDGNAAVDGGIWVYATGMIDLRRSAIEVIPGTVAEATDREVNTVEYRAQRFAAATWDGCCLGAAEIDLPLCDIGGAGS